MTLPPREQYLSMEKLKDKGFYTLKTFPGEYALMMNFDTAVKARVFENGTVMLQYKDTGEYAEVDL